MVLQNMMKYLPWTVFLLICFSPCDSQQGIISHPEVTIPQGVLKGTTLTTRGDRSVSAFLGIPFAQPPIGDLRFANPVAADGWTGTRNATVDGNRCPQIDGTAYIEEDCLNINVYTPKLSANGSSTLLPVLVWIYGGSLMSGSQKSDMYGPEYLLDADVVLAAPNYRVGPLGFLSTGDEVASGNWGLKDQILALKWVQDNIEYFGGDPNQVTLFGQSAGGTSVHLLSLSNATIGLFHRYITQSGTAVAPFSTIPRARCAKRAFKLGEYLGCTNDTSASLISCLRRANVSDILASYSQVHWGSLFVWLPTVEPDIDGAVITDSPKNIIAAGGIRDLPWINGVVRDEGALFSSSYSEDYILEFVNNFDTRYPELMELAYQSESETAMTTAVKEYYFNDLTANTSELLTNYKLLMGDVFFYYPAYNALKQQHALAVNPQYFYTFNYVGSLSYTFDSTGVVSTNHPVTHSDDLLYLFSSPAWTSKYDVNRSESDYLMVDTMVELWTSFAINGTPKTTANNNTVTWGAYSTEDNYLRIGNGADLDLEVHYSFLKERMEFWAALYSASSSSEAATTYKTFLLSLPIISKVIAMMLSTLSVTPNDCTTLLA